MTPDSWLSGYWDPENSALTMLPETVASSPFHWTLCLLVSILCNHMFHSVAKIYPTLLPPPPGQRSRGNSLPLSHLSFLPFLLPPLPILPCQNLHHGPLAHTGLILLNPPWSLLRSSFARLLPFSALSGRYLEAMGLFNLFSFLPSGSLTDRKCLGFFPANLSVYIKEFCYLSQAYDITCRISLLSGPPLSLLRNGVKFMQHLDSMQTRPT